MKMVVVCLTLVLADGQLCSGQGIVWNDSVLISSFRNPADSGPPLLVFRVISGIDYSLNLSGLHASNWKGGDLPAQVAGFHHIKYQSKILNEKSFRFTCTIDHDLGIYWLVDSLTRFQPDANVIDLKAQLKLSRRFALLSQTMLNSGLLNDYRPSGTSGWNEKVLQSGFLTPLVVKFSGGISWQIPGYGSLHLGVTGGKLTYIRNHRVYTSQGVQIFRGVPIERNFEVEYGLLMQILLDKKFSAILQWNCEVNLFKPYHEVPDVSVKNLLGFRLGKYFKGTVQTRLCYEEEVSRRWQLENQVNAGITVQW